MSAQYDPVHHNPAHHDSMTRSPVPQKRGDDEGWRGFGVAIVGYLVLSVQQPLGWGVPVWSFLAFLLVPALTGVAIGLSQRGLGTPGRSFWTGIKSAGKAMALYTICHLLLLGGPHSDGANKGQERIAGVLTTLLFTLIAGLVAGTVSATVSGGRAKERQV